MTTLKKLTNCNLQDENGTILGQPQEILFDKSSGKCLFAVNSSVYAADSITDYTETIITSKLHADIGAYPFIVGKTAYDASGKRLGTVTDAIIGKTAVINKLILDNGQLYGRGRISAVGEIVIIKIVKSPQQKVKRQKKQVNISADVQISASENETADKAITIRRRCGDFSFLLGKTADKNITNFFGEIMIRHGDKVTVDILRQAKLSGKLIELCLHVN